MIFSNKIIVTRIWGASTSGGPFESQHTLQHHVMKVQVVNVDLNSFFPWRDMVTCFSVLSSSECNIVPPEDEEDELPCSVCCSNDCRVACKFSLVVMLVVNMILSFTLHSDRLGAGQHTHLTGATLIAWA